jgi:hypothetical protein
MLQNDNLQSKFSKADLKTVSVLKIPARTTCPVRLGTAIGAMHTYGSRIQISLNNWQY